jgi:Histidine-specific methyltransferase, SAM-dependent
MPLETGADARINPAVSAGAGDSAGLTRAGPGWRLGRYVGKFVEQDPLRRSGVLIALQRVWFLAWCKTRELGVGLRDGARGEYLPCPQQHPPGHSRRLSACLRVWFHVMASVLYVPETMTVEGHLYATEDQTVTLRALDHTLILRCGDRICHGHSVKFHRPEFVDAVCAFGFELDAEWIDAVWQYGLFLFVRR